MPTYTAPASDMSYILNDVLRISDYAHLKGFEEVSEDLVKAILEEGGKFCENVLQPLNQKGDEEGCTWHQGGTVTTPDGFREAYEAFCEGGWLGLTQNPDYGGQGLPYVLWIGFEEMSCAANLAFNMYPGLTSGAAGVINEKGTKAQKQAYLPNLISGKWTGTMNLTEPHCGTDLGLLRTKAEPDGNGAYKITGTKIFISSGEHDLAENIIHLVLARLPGAPEGTKGISMFIVPKYHINEDGSPGERNGVTCGSIEKKMGIHGNATCVMNYDGATGYLFGKPNEGLKTMFIMMNAARIGVGIQGLGLSEVAYQNAVAYAKERRSGRALTGPADKDAKADPIIVHPDVRRMLMNARAFNEGARAAAMWTGLLSDISRKSEDEKERQEADDLLSLLTPVIKGYVTDMAYKGVNDCMQVYGGHGYIREWGMEQFVRDARIAQIYEGTNGIQALDLVGRKLARNQGRAVIRLFQTISGFIGENEKELEEFTKPLAGALQDMQKATQWLQENAVQNPNHAGAGATAYMHLTGLVLLGFMWARMAKVSSAALKGGGGDSAFHERKLATARYFMARMLPGTGLHLAQIRAGADTLMALDAGAF